MKSFKDYRPQTSEQTDGRARTGETEGADVRAERNPAAEAGVDPEFGQTATELTRKIAAAWNGKPSGEMLKSILSEAEKSKRAGTLTNEEIDGFYAQFSPLLSEPQRRKLRSVVEKLKRI